MAETQTAPPAAAPTSSFQVNLSSTGAVPTTQPATTTTGNTTTGTTSTTPAATPSTLFPGDAILPDADTIYDQRKTIHAAADDVWPWLVQWGKGRGGWYIPAKFEKALPEKYRSAPTIDPQWQTLKVGDKVPDYGLGASKKSKNAAPVDPYHLEVAVIETHRALVYKGQRLGQDFTWALLLESPSGAAAGTGSSADSTASAAECVLHLRFRGKTTETGWKAKVALKIGKVADGMMASAIFPGIADRVEQAEKKVVAKPVAPAQAPATATVTV